MKSKYSFDLRPASREEAGLFYSNDEQDEALGTVGHLRLDFGHGFLPLRSTCYGKRPHLRIHRGNKPLPFLPPLHPTAWGLSGVPLLL